ncbi:MAG: radical SAM protein [Peptoniphilus harei]|uniref:Anaerobic sulfatase-maturating enzyme n=1 Tax=Peptoniphilus gorbachii TaxID=411567 RepID=A0A6N3CK04_9FIRM|nr:radical SAM protein [Peptoniphilus harei]MBS6720980.1 radical SAM protein [Peptoniphilus harei]MDU1023372.1 radical SAM protein [Peptoniphilus harei]MDU3010620.1 radical SAM protein [Peptoniphilus harei]MDU4046551.1 radical SAM protein [Peptoniphilus harei]
MNTAIKDKTKEKVFSKAVNIAYKKIKKDPQKGMMDIVDVFDEYLLPKSGEVNSGKVGLERIRNELSDPNSKWVSFGTDIVNEIDENIVKTSVRTIGYNAAYKGNTLRNKLQKEYNCNIPWVILFDPTSACNLKCTGCWAAEYGHKNNLTYDEMASIVKQGNELGTYFFILTGGEPLVRKDDVIRLAKEFNDSAFHIFTNGTLIDDEFCQKVVEAGNISFALSIEGTEESTDLRRGDGVFQKVMKAMDLMKEHKLLYGASICYTSQNYKYVTDDDFIKMLVDHGCKLAWFFHYMPVGKDADVSLLLSPEEREHVYHKVREIRSFDYPQNIFTIDFQNDGEFINGCIAGGKNYFHINSLGDMEPCVFIHYSDSNIREKTIKECLTSPLFMGFHDNQPFNKNLLKPCPMLENPGRLTKIVNDSGARNTDMIAPESAEDLQVKTTPYAMAWNKKANELWDESRKKKEEMHS